MGYRHWLVVAETPPPNEKVAPKQSEAHAALWVKPWFKTT